ncbi:MAG: hypothetical protein MUF84_18060 [Anaerolineae bacterium]|nr:hypothetical protein [Anaerolineae bacterium]
MTRAHDTAARVARWTHFLSDPDAGHLYMITYTPDEEESPRSWRELADVRVEWAWRKYERQLARQTWLWDDSLPYLDMRTGTEIFAEAFGCPVHFPDDNMPFALPLVHSAREAEALKVPEVSTSSVAYLFDMADELMRRAGPGALVKVVDVQSPMDIAALIWEKSSFYPALIESPEAVLELADKVKRFLIAFLEAWFARYGRDFIAHYPDYYMPQGITLSEDEVGAVSARVFNELFLPELAELSEHFGGIGVHCCAHARHQWAGFKAIPGLRLINFVQPEAVLVEAYRAFSAVPQMHSWCGDGDPWTWPMRYQPGSRVVIQATARTQDEACYIADKLQQQLQPRMVL